MSMQAQAERERQARVILGDSERQVAEKFGEAAKTYAKDPIALHLRAMNMLYEGLKTNATIVIVPSTAVETMQLGGLAGMTALTMGLGQGAREEARERRARTSRSHDRAPRCGNRGARGPRGYLRILHPPGRANANGIARGDGMNVRLPDGVNRSPSGRREREGRLMVARRSADFTSAFAPASLRLLPFVEGRGGLGHHS